MLVPIHHKINNQKQQPKKTTKKNNTASSPSWEELSWIEDYFYEQPESSLLKMKWL